MQRHYNDCCHMDEHYRCWFLRFGPLYIYVPCGKKCHILLLKLWFPRGHSDMWHVYVSVIFKGCRIYWCLMASTWLSSPQTQLNTMVSSCKNVDFDPSYLCGTLYNFVFHDNLGSLLSMVKTSVFTRCFLPIFLVVAFASSTVIFQKAQSTNLAQGQCWSKPCTELLCLLQQQEVVFWTSINKVGPRKTQQPLQDLHGILVFLDPEFINASHN